MNQPRQILVTLILALMSAAVAAESRLDIRLDNAALSWQRLKTGIGGELPERLIADSAGVVVVPQLIKAGFAVAGSYGRGVLLRRGADGRWQPPVFITASGGSFGWQAGVQALELVLIFRDAEAVDALQKRGLTLGADASVAAGPFGRKTGAASDFASDAAVISYAVAEGLFAGVALDGMLIRIESRNTASFYRNAGFEPPFKPTVDASALPASAQRLMDLFGGYDANVAKTERASDNDDGLVTFGIGEAPLDDNEN
ncbi:MAG: lipid-binding SYLF domain-containing protein [Pseudomonadota bacterium]